MSSVQQDRNHCFSRSEVAGLGLASRLPPQWGLAEWGCTHPPWLSKVLKKETAMFQHLMFLKLRNRGKFYISLELISVESLWSFLSLKLLVAPCSGWSRKVLAVVSSQRSLSIIRKTKSLAENILNARHYCSALRNACSLGWARNNF